MWSSVGIVSAFFALSLIFGSDTGEDVGSFLLICAIIYMVVTKADHSYDRTKQTVHALTDRLRRARRRELRRRRSMQRDGYYSPSSPDPESPMTDIHMSLPRDVLERMQHHTDEDLMQALAGSPASP